MVRYHTELGHTGFRERRFYQHAERALIVEHLADEGVVLIVETPAVPRLAVIKADWPGLLRGALTEARECLPEG